MSVIDTNMLVYVTDPSSGRTDRASSALRALGGGGGMCVSRQILREYLAVMTRPQPRRGPLSMTAAFDAIDRLTQYVELPEDGPTAWIEVQSLSKRFDFSGKQVHDANIVATMLAYGETRILTDNAKHSRRFEPLIEIIEP